MAEVNSKPPAKAAAKAAKDASEAKTPKTAAAKTPRAAKTAAGGEEAAAKKTASPAPSRARAKKVPAETPVALVVVPQPATKITGKAMVVSDEQRYRMVAEAAYYRAESNHFKSDPVRDWIEAENDIAALLSGSSK